MDKTLKMSQKRIMQDLKEIQSKNSSCRAAMKGNNMYEWVALIEGPPETPYAGGVFYLDITFPKDYPIRPPKVRFTTPIYHPNINKVGAVCINILKNDWFPALTAEMVILSLGSLLAEPNPDDPLEPEIGNLYKKDKFKFQRKAYEWTKQYAM